MCVYLLCYKYSRMDQLLNLIRGGKSKKKRSNKGKGGCPCSENIGGRRRSRSPNRVHRKKGGCPCNGTPSTLDVTGGKRRSRSPHRRRKGGCPDGDGTTGGKRRSRSPHRRRKGGCPTEDGTIGGKRRSRSPHRRNKGGCPCNKNIGGVKSKSKKSVTRPKSNEDPMDFLERSMQQATYLSDTHKRSAAARRGLLTKNANKKIGVINPKIVRMTIIGERASMRPRAIPTRFDPNRKSKIELFMEKMKRRRAAQKKDAAEDDTGLASLFQSSRL